MANAGPASLYPVVKPGDTIFLRRPAGVLFSRFCQGLQRPPFRGTEAELSRVAAAR